MDYQQYKWGWYWEHLKINCKINDFIFIEIEILVLYNYLMFLIPVIGLIIFKLNKRIKFEFNELYIIFNVEV